MQDQISGLLTKSLEKPSDFLCCAFGLSNSEIDIYFALLSGPKTVKDVRSQVEKRSIDGNGRIRSRKYDRSTVQRVLTRLEQKGLVERETHQIKRGGYYYVYKSISTEDVRHRILTMLEEWYQSTRKFLLDSWTDRLE